ncbi:hypothetical protein SAMN02745165_02107 [Malonomonas rubra DSM 5091]|uniref:GerMN domain-containing protein n=1 Tax=Malonomonas rubra DSM 5091 TaxID=1122189 RepID=A0A1M6IC23_MALRU|nr:hypothetical protein [Malonomonas rubra]SHJ31988.1 hypothetical protein SAMN02745165_02107 [Malonomonas rubra DSM 5091]
MLRKYIPLLCCLLLLSISCGAVITPAFASEQEERVRLLQEKLKKLKQLLVQMEEQKLKETPPQEIPWEPLLDFGLERPAYDQYAYLVAPQMKQDILDSALQQLYFFASQDELKERGTLFVVPALPLAEGEVMSVSKYNRELAVRMVRKIDLPSALEGGVLVLPDPINEEGVADGPMLLIDLTGCDQMMRARIFELLQSVRLYTEDGSIQDYIMALLKSASPQAFSVFIEGERAWLALDND